MTQYDDDSSEYAQEEAFSRFIELSISEQRDQVIASSRGKKLLQVTATKKRG